MSALLPVNINGVVHQAHGEYTAGAVAEEFQNSLAAFVNIFNLGLDDNISGVNPNSSTLSSDILNKIANVNYETELLNALLGGTVILNKEVVSDPTRPPTPVTVTGLFNLAADGISVTNDPVLSPGTRFLSVEMAGALDQLVRSLRTAGVNIQDDGNGKLTVVGGITKTMVRNWRNLAATSDAIRRIIQFAVDTSGNQNRTLQALVELIYVRTGNELLADNLERLEGALSITKESIDALNRLQALHNKITAASKTPFFDTLIAPGSPNATAFVRGAGSQGGVNAEADEHFTAIEPDVQFEPGRGDLTNADRLEFTNLRLKLQEQISALSAQTAQGESGSLLENLRRVLSDINAAITTQDPSAFTRTGGPNALTIQLALQRWILDNTNTNFNNIPGLESGQIQRNLSAAVSASQSLNDTQKEEVRRFLFVFEEYYKSAAAILSKITQIIERMAQAVAR